MPTFVTHAVVGLAAGSVYKNLQPRPEPLPWRFWLAAAALPVVPDLDVAAFALGIPYAHPLGHRGFVHSLLFATVLGLGTALLVSFARRRQPGRVFALAALFSTIAASHPLLDAMTSGGLGIALLSPFDTTRYFFPVTPIEVSPIGIRRFFSEWGLRVALSELLWVWLPSLGLAGLVYGLKRWRGSVRTDRSPDP